MRMTYSENMIHRLFCEPYNMDQEQTQTHNVNGPVNMVRLEGEINGIQKVLYVIMDIHLDEREQKECPEEDNIDLHHYLKMQFEQSKKTGKKYDFFLEISPPSLRPNSYSSIMKQIYILQTRKFFRRHLKVNEKMDKVLVSPKLPHVRFHYIDTRDFFRLESGMNTNIWTFLPVGITESPMPHQTATLLVRQIDETVQDIQNWKKLLSDVNVPTKTDQKPRILQTAHQPVTNEDLIKMRKQLLHKIFHKYNHNTVKNPINQIAKEHVLPNLDQLLDHLTKLRKLSIKYAEHASTSPDKLIRHPDGNYGYGPFAPYILEMTTIVVDRIIE